MEGGIVIFFIFGVIFNCFVKLWSWSLIGFMLIIYFVVNVIGFVWFLNIFGFV